MKFNEIKAQSLSRVDLTISRSDVKFGGRRRWRRRAPGTSRLQGLVLSRSSSRAFRRNIGNFCQDRGHVIPRSSHATRARQVARANARHARTHARTHARRLVHMRCKQRHARTTLHLLCIYTTWLWAWSHGTQPWREHKRPALREKRKRRGRRRSRRATGEDCGGVTWGADPRHATFGFIVVYPVTVRFPRSSKILRRSTFRARLHNEYRAYSDDQA